MLNMDKVIARYRELLPARFEDLSTDFAVGVYTRDGKYRVIDSGPLPEAVVASAAIPLVFEHVDVPGVGQCMDGGKHDRVGLTGWEQRERRRGKVWRTSALHARMQLVERCLCDIACCYPATLHDAQTHSAAPCAMMGATQNTYSTVD